MIFNRTKNTARTFAFGTLSKLITILGPFATRTIIIYKLGTEYLGLSSLFTSILTILNISELGIGSAIVFCLYKPVAEDDTETVCALLSFLRKMYKIIGATVIGLGIITIPFLHLFIHGKFPPDINIYVLYLLYLLSAGSSYLGYAYKGVLFNAYQRGDVIHQIESFGAIVKYVLQIVILLLFSNYYWFVAMLPLSTILITIITEICSRKYYPTLRPHGTVRPEMKKVIKEKVLYLSAHSIAATLINSIDNIIISSFIGLTAVGLYGNYHYISTSLIAVFLIASRALTPVIGNVLVTEKEEDVYKLFNALLFVCFWIVTFSSTALLCLYQPFMTIWVGKDNLLSFAVVIMTTLFFCSTAARQLFTTYVSAAGLWNKTLKRQIIAAFVNLVLDLALVKPFGIAGIVFASFFTNSVIALPMDIYVTYKNILNKKAVIGFYKAAMYFALGAGICTITYLANSFIAISDKLYLEFCIRILICVLIPNLLLFLFFFKTQQFSFIRAHIRSLMPKQKGISKNSIG